MYQMLNRLSNHCKRIPAKKHEHAESEAAGSTRQMQLVHVSPFGVIPKSEFGKWRLTLDLGGNSVNDGVNSPTRL